MRPHSPREQRILAELKKHHRRKNPSATKINALYAALHYCKMAESIFSDRYDQDFIIEEWGEALEFIEENDFQSLFVDEEVLQLLFGTEEARLFFHGALRIAATRISASTQN